MVTLHEVITFLVSMQISISSLQTHNVNRCGRSRHLARKLSLRRKRSSPNVFEMAATETITSILLIKLLRVSLGTVRHPRRFKIVVIDIQITLKQMLRDFIGIRVNRAKDRKSGSAGMPRPISYAVFCLKKKRLNHRTPLQIMRRTRLPPQPPARPTPTHDDPSAEIHATRLRSRRHCGAPHTQI